MFFYFFWEEKGSEICKPHPTIVLITKWDLQQVYFQYKILKKTHVYIRHDHQYSHLPSMKKIENPLFTCNHRGCNPRKDDVITVHPNTPQKSHSSMPLKIIRQDPTHDGPQIRKQIQSKVSKRGNRPHLLRESAPKDQVLNILRITSIENTSVVNSPQPRWPKRMHSTYCNFFLCRKHVPK